MSEITSPTGHANNNLHRARREQNDEFYTRLEDIENEMKHYRNHFKGKVVYCNCDDPRESNFFHYFSFNFEKLGLKRLIATCYKNADVHLFSKHDSEKAVYQIYDGDKNGNFVPDDDEISIKYLEGDGDFRSPECIALLEQADIVVTNPPFSLFREYIAQLMEFDKKFIVLGNFNGSVKKNVFNWIQDNKMWLGVNNGAKTFTQPCGSEKKFGNVVWYSNLNHSRRNEKIILIEKYDAKIYPNYDDYDAINVNKVKDIPIDYDGVMGVPISILDKYNPKQFDIVGVRHDLEINKQKIFARILIQHKQ